MDINYQLEKILEIGISLSQQTDIDVLLNQILLEARRFTNCDAGSLYIKDKDSLRFVISHCDSLNLINKTDIITSFQERKIPISSKSLSGYVALTGETLNIDDVYQIPIHYGFTIDKSFDIDNNYKSISMLLTPMQIPGGEIIGVLQLINAMDESGNVIAFRKEYEKLVQALASNAAVSINNVKLASKLKKSYLDTIIRLAIAAEYRDKETYHHIERISSYSAIIARHLGFKKEEIELIQYASPMHDIGKLGIPDAVLLKDGKLTPDERKIIEEHTVIGEKILSGSESPMLELSCTIAVTHHEKYDGTGYPKGLKHDEIPIAGRIVAIVDVFDALYSKRCYKPAFELDKVFEIIESEKGKHFDPECVDVFFKSKDEILNIANKYKDP